MADVRPNWPPGATNAYLLVPILLLFALLIAAVLRGPSLISSAGIGSAVIVTAPLALATYALMATAMAGRGTVDLSVGPLLGFINVSLVQLNGLDVVTSPLAVFAFVIAVGAAYQLVMALIIIFVRVQPIIVALSGYLALSGINLVILPRPGGSAPEWMMSWGLGTSILSPVLAILVAATAAWLLFTRTAFYGHLRLMGSDERAAYSSGVRISIVRLGAHAISGVFIGLAALSYTALVGSGDPTQGTAYTLIAVTALVLGGTSLAGGRGGVIGSLLGAVAVADGGPAARAALYPAHLAVSGVRGSVAAVRRRDAACEVRLLALDPSRSDGGSRCAGFHCADNCGHAAVRPAGAGALHLRGGSARQRCDRHASEVDAAAARRRPGRAAPVRAGAVRACHRGPDAPWRDDAAAVRQFRGDHRAERMGAHEFDECGACTADGRGRWLNARG